MTIVNSYNNSEVYENSSRRVFLTMVKTPNKNLVMKSEKIKIPKRKNKEESNNYCKGYLSGTLNIYHTRVWKYGEVMKGKYQEYYRPLEDFHMLRIFCNYKYVFENGKFESWHEDGYKANEGRRKNGKKIGKFVKWYDDRGLESIIHYKDGKMDGISINNHKKCGKFLEIIYKKTRILRKFENGNMMK